MEAGHQELGAVPLDRVARARGWSEGQIHNARRLLDGGMGERLGYKSFEETTVAGEDEEAVAGEAWVYYLYEDRIAEVSDLI
jgi:hypothetical protein